MVIEDVLIPVQPEVDAACSLLGLDPLFVANEGKLLAIVVPESADAILAQMRAHPLGARACAIGRVTEKHPGLLVSKTRIGATRVVPMQLGEQLPRIC
jgi:hydrogenase expression/formation protein HypE